MGGQRSRVEVYSMFTMVSSKPIEQVTTHPIGPLDLALGLHTLHMVFYYPNIWVTGLLESDRLRASISEVLSRYPVVTGRLVRPGGGGGGNWEVKFNDAGVRVLRARVGATLHEWLRSATAAEERDLTVWEEMPEDPAVWAPFRIQVNEFREGRVAIGLSCTHLLADPISAIQLFKSWADNHRRQPIPQPMFFHQTTYSGHRQIPNADTKFAFFDASMSKAQSAQQPLVNMETVTFRFSNSMMEQWLSNSKVHDKCLEATPFHFLAALFWTRVSRLKPPLPKGDNKHRLSLCMNSRKRMNAELPAINEYFGNALQFSLLSLDAEEMKEVDLEHVAGLVLRHMSAGLEDGVELVSMVPLAGENGQINASPFRVYGLELTCIDMEQFVPSIYEAAMFEEGEQPVHISCRIGNLGSEGLILVMPSPEEGLGRTVTVTLLKEHMGKLCEDEAILSLRPTILLN